MNVGELKRILSNYSDDLPLLVSQDPEGNGFYKLADLDEHLFVDTGRYWIDEVWMTNEQIDEAISSDKPYYSEEDRAPEEAILALILWP